MCSYLLALYESMCTFHSLLSSHHSAFVLFLCIDVVNCTPQLIFIFHTQHVIIARSTTVFNEQTILSLATMIQKEVKDGMIDVVSRLIYSIYIF